MCDMQDTAADYAAPNKAKRTEPFLLFSVTEQKENRSRLRAAGRKIGKQRKKDKKLDRRCTHPGQIVDIGDRGKPVHRTLLYQVKPGAMMHAGRPRQTKKVNADTEFSRHVCKEPRVCLGTRRTL